MALLRRRRGRERTRESERTAHLEACLSRRCGIHRRTAWNLRRSDEKANASAESSPPCPPPPPHKNHFLPNLSQHALHQLPIPLNLGSSRKKRPHTEQTTKPLNKYLQRQN